MLKKSDVESLIKYLNDTGAVDDHNRIGLARLAVTLDRVEQLSADGKVEDDAQELTAELLSLGARWLKANPDVAKLKERVFTFEKVKNVILYFNDTDRVPDDDEAKLNDLVKEYVAFESRVREGWVEDGAATELAQEFVKGADAWFADNPKMKAAYDELSVGARR